MHYVKAKSLLSSKNGMNIYRGCQHGCIYCDSRSVCYGMEHDFDDVCVKQSAPELLENTLKKKRKRCMIGLGSMSDPYMPLEKELKYTQRCMEIAEKYGFGFSFITKSDLALRDLDLIKSVNDKSKCVVQMTLTTFDDKLSRMIEPGVCTSSERAKALGIFSQNKIPTIVWLSPLLPFINDTEENLRGILSLCAESGVKGVICFGIGLTLREGNREYFYQKLDENFPGLKNEYIKRYGNMYGIMSPNNVKLMRIFHSECERYGMMHSNEEIFSYLYRYESKYETEQLSFFNLI